MITEILKLKVGDLVFNNNQESIYIITKIIYVLETSHDVKIKFIKLADPRVEFWCWYNFDQKIDKIN